MAKKKKRKKEKKKRAKERKGEQSGFRSCRSFVYSTWHSELHYFDNADVIRLSALNGMEPGLEVSKTKKNNEKAEA